MKPNDEKPRGPAFRKAAGQAALLWAAAAAIAVQLLPGGQLDLPADPAARVWVLLRICVVLPVLEELLFRGGVQWLLRALGGPGIALAGQAVLFALAHGTGAQKLYALAMGLIFGWSAERTGRVWPGMVLHSINNWIVLAGCLAGRGA